MEIIRGVAKLNLPFSSFANPFLHFLRTINYDFSKDFITQYYQKRREEKRRDTSPWGTNDRRRTWFFNRPEQSISVRKVRESKLCHPGTTLLSTAEPPKTKPPKSDSLLMFISVSLRDLAHLGLYVGECYTTDNNITLIVHFKARNKINEWIYETITIKIDKKFLYTVKQWIWRRNDEWDKDNDFTSNV